jgi:hypothetical protein
VVNPANGAYDFVFKLFDAEASGNQIGSPITLTNVTVSEGLFNADLDFGANVFTGEARYLEIAVRPTGTGSYETLLPRISIRPVPYALHADTAVRSAAPKLRYFEPFQNIPTAGAQDWEFFTIGSESYLAVANYRDSPSNNNVDSKIYHWNGAISSKYKVSPLMAQSTGSSILLMETTIWRLLIVEMAPITTLIPRYINGITTIPPLYWHKPSLLMEPPTGNFLPSVRKNTWPWRIGTMAQHIISIPLSTIGMDSSLNLPTILLQVEHMIGNFSR